MLTWNKEQPFVLSVVQPESIYIKVWGQHDEYASTSTVNYRKQATYGERPNTGKHTSPSHPDLRVLVLLPCQNHGALAFTKALLMYYPRSTTIVELPYALSADRSKCMFFSMAVTPLADAPKRTRKTAKLHAAGDLTPIESFWINTRSIGDASDVGTMPRQSVWICITAIQLRKTWVSQKLRNTAAND
jgi:hypothetical protein